MFRRALLWSMLVAPVAAQAQGRAPAAGPAPGGVGFEALWTSWRAMSRDSLRAETDQRQTPAVAGAVPAMAQQGRSHGEAVALGERVAEAVRRGDCVEGERIAREAGDFPLVRAVRDYCRTRS